MSRRYFVTMRPEGKRPVLVRILDGDKIFAYSKRGHFGRESMYVGWLMTLVQRGKMKEVDFSTAARFARQWTTKLPDMLAEALDWLR